MNGATTYSAGDNTSPWTEVRIAVPAGRIDDAGDIAQMTVPYGIYVEDYRFLEEEVDEIAHIDLIDEDLLRKDRDHGIVHVYLEPGENPAEAVAFLRERYAASGIDNDISVLPCKHEDWQNNWKKFFQPQNVGTKLLIQPSWLEDGGAEANGAARAEEAVPADGRRKLLIEPGLAFGTGSHDTTRLCLEALEEIIRGGESVLDLGCGSGILGIAALLLGAARAVGVDIDDIAVKTARANGALNGFTEPQFTVHCGDMTEKVQGTFDLVVANIVADIIVPFCESARRFLNEGSVFLVSGIIDSREDDVLAAFAANRFTVRERRQSGEWLCFLVS